MPVYDEAWNTADDPGEMAQDPVDSPELTDEEAWDLVGSDDPTRTLAEALQREMHEHGKEDSAQLNLRGFPREIHTAFRWARNHYTGPAVSASGNSYTRQPSQGELVLAAARVGLNVLQQMRWNRLPFDELVAHGAFGVIGAEFAFRFARCGALDSAEMHWQPVLTKKLVAEVRDRAEHAGVAVPTMATAAFVAAVASDDGTVFGSSPHSFQARAQRGVELFNLAAQANAAMIEVSNQ